MADELKEDTPVQPVYPRLGPTDREQELIDKLSNQRAEIIKNKLQGLENLHKHYKKISNRWNKIAKGFRIGGISISSLCGGAAIVTGVLLSSGIALPLMIPAALSGVALVDEWIAECALHAYSKKKKHYFDNKCEIIQKYLNRLYNLEQKIIDDGKITVQEFESFEKVMQEYQAELHGHKAEATKINDEMDMESIRREATKEALEQTKKDLKERIILEERERLMKAGERMRSL
jgi:hypothetical protein